MINVFYDHVPACSPPLPRNYNLSYPYFRELWRIDSFIITSSNIVIEFAYRNTLWDQPSFVKFVYVPILTTYSAVITIRLGFTVDGQSIVFPTRAVRIKIIIYSRTGRAVSEWPTASKRDCRWPAACFCGDPHVQDNPARYDGSQCTLRSAWSTGVSHLFIWEAGDPLEKSKLEIFLVSSMLARM